MLLLRLYSYYHTITTSTTTTRRELCLLKHWYLDKDILTEGSLTSFFPECLTTSPRSRSDEQRRSFFFSQTTVSKFENQLSHFYSTTITTPADTATSWLKKINVQTKIINNHPAVLTALALVARWQISKMERALLEHIWTDRSHYSQHSSICQMTTVDITACDFCDKVAMTFSRWRLKNVGNKRLVKWIPSFAADLMLSYRQANSPKE